MSILIISTSLIICFIMHLIFYKQSSRLGLLEMPGGRKVHQGATPLVGGVSIYLSSVVAIFLFPFSTFTTSFVLLLFPIVLIGVIDDIFDISAKIRLAFQLIISLVGAQLFGLEIGLSSLFSEESLLTNLLDQCITVIFIVTLMNAINMMDGMDGLVGSMLLLSLLAIAYEQNLSLQGSTNQLLNVLIPCLIIFLVFNIGMKTRKHLGKVFMGDAGSMFLGFFLAVHLIHTSQGLDQRDSAPFLSSLWFVFLPLADMLSTLMGRVVRRKSPLKADRTHIHHILQRAGFNKRKTLQLLVIVHVIFISIGIVSFHIDLSLIYTAVLLTIVFTIYRLILSKAPSFIRAKSRQLRRQSKNNEAENFEATKNIYDRVSI